MFEFYNAVMSEGNPTNTNNCCILGYHDINGAQTYGTAEFEGRDQTLFSGVSDTSGMGHEIAEWMNDPTGVNNGNTMTSRRDNPGGAISALRGISDRRGIYFSS